MEAISSLGILFVRIEQHGQSDLNVRVNPLVLFASASIPDDLNQALNQSLVHALLAPLGSGLEKFALEAPTDAHSGLEELRMPRYPFSDRPICFGSV